MTPLERLATHWWVVLLRGLLAIIFGVLATLYVVQATAAFVIVFGAFAFADGVLTIVAALRFAHPDTGRWWAMLLGGFAGAAIGVITFFSPQATWIALGYLVAAWAIVTGIFGIAAAVRLRRDVPGEILMIFAGLVAIAAGAVLVWIGPALALVSLVWVIAIYALIAGAAMVVFSFRLRRLQPSPA